MSYSSYKYFTRKQCNVIYKAFKNGQLTPPKDCRGKVKREGFVYNYEGASFRHGFNLSKENKLFNGQILTLETVVGLICKGEYEEAQLVLDGKLYFRDHFPEWVEPEKMWKVVY